MDEKNQTPNNDQNGISVNSDGAAAVDESFKKYNRNIFQKLGFAIWDYIKGVGLMLWGVLKVLPSKIWALLKGFGLGVKDLVLRFIHGDWKTKLSYLIMGFSCFFYGQYLPGVAYVGLEALFVLYTVLVGVPNLAKFGTLGTHGSRFDENGNLVQGDNSLTILIFSIIFFVFLVFFIAMYVKNTKTAETNRQYKDAGLHINNTKEQIASALNHKFSSTVLVLPILGVVIINITPLIINVLTAFTTFDNNHIPPGALFTWEGSNFAKLFGGVGTGSFGYTFWHVLGWTLVWAFFATFTNYFAGIIVALMINKKSIKLKAMWRTFFVMSIAVPQFISLLVVSKMFATEGIINSMLKQAGWITENIRWLDTTTNARIMVIVINMWVGIPYTILTTTGILMNIPEDLYESARIDGAGAVRRFFSITMPYMLFVTAPQLITTFTGNINNFNVIFLLTGGEPTTTSYMYGAGKTDLLITWLYDLTVTNRNYNVGSVIGILIFIIMTFFSLIVFNSTKSMKQEDTFK